MVYVAPFLQVRYGRLLPITGLKNFSWVIKLNLEALAKLLVIPECFYPSPNDSIGDTSIRGRIWFFKQLEPDSRSESLRE